MPRASNDATPRTAHMPLQKESSPLHLERCPSLAHYTSFWHMDPAAKASLSQGLGSLPLSNTFANYLGLPSWLIRPS